ncbi:MAG TPA: type VI secretion system baseplate subunit TssG [Planctomicrobium sp.]|nr:type VI secretion system baseplate subunit TssG [Planctomicrobium sp.]
MAKTVRQSAPDLIEQLKRSPQGFELFQAVRLLQFRCASQNGTKRNWRLGSDALPGNEPVRFIGTASLAFPDHEVESVEVDDGHPHRMVLRTPVMGVFGPTGVLPTHYTRLMIDRIRRNDESLRDFLDIFNHRALSLFYRAWEKYHLAANYELSGVQQSEDLLTQSLYSLIGLGSTALSPTVRESSRMRNRLRGPDTLLLEFMGFFATRSRNVASLQQMLGSVTGTIVEVLQFRGRWLQLSTEDQSAMPGRAYPKGLNSQLGVNALIGGRVWSGEGQFRIRLGPLTHRQFQELSPGYEMMQVVSELTAMYVDAGLEFDLQPVLRAAEIPEIQLGQSSRLGWDSWLCSKPRERDGDEAVFHPVGMVAPLATYS